MTMHEISDFVLCTKEVSGHCGDPWVVGRETGCGKILDVTTDTPKGYRRPEIKTRHFLRIQHVSEWIAKYLIEHADSLRERDDDMWSIVDQLLQQKLDDPVNHPKHYTEHPSGVECIQITEHMSFNVGNAVKYIWRCDLKHDAVEDLKKARWYVEREIQRRSGAEIFYRLCDWFRPGVQCTQITEHMDATLGLAFSHLWCGNLKYALSYIDLEIKNRTSHTL